MREKGAAEPEVFPSLPKIPPNDVTETIFTRNLKHQYHPHYPIFLVERLQTLSVEPTERFGIYIEYIRRLFSKGGLVP